MRFEVFRKQDIADGIEQSDGRSWLLGAENADEVFVGFWTRTRRADIDVQPWRWHDADEVELIVQGTLHCQVGHTDGTIMEDVILETGDLFYIGKGVRHRADAVGSEACIGLLFCPKAYPIASGQPSWTDGSVAT
jgi:mannose-6-phosphate isomerase-like protein (cupin superfamily)